MQPFFIKSFKSTVGNAVWSYNTVGECYNVANGQTTKKLYDFLGVNGFVIESIQRNEHQPTVGQALPTGTTFSINSILRNGAHQKKITSIIIVNGLPIFKCVSTTTGEDVNDTTLANAQLYVEETTNTVGASNPARIAEIQAQILAANPRALRVQGLLRNRGNQTLADFMRAFFEEFNNTAVESGATRNTVYTDTDDIQTVRGKRRSLGDIFMIMRWYFPTCTLKDVAKLLYVTLPASMPHLASCKCSEIRKRVWFYDESRTNEYKQPNDADEYILSKTNWLSLVA